MPRSSLQGVAFTKDQVATVAAMVVEVIHKETSRPALDPIGVAREAGIELDPWQVDCLLDDSPQILMNASRQSGKSTVGAIDAVSTALSYSSALVLLLSPSLRQSTELFRKCLDVYRALDAKVPAAAESALRLELRNGSRIIALPGTEGTVRGYSGAKLIIFDEASRIEDPLYRSVRPMLAVSRGRLRAMSTPFGKRGWWYEEWEYGGAADAGGWSRYKVPATMCPRISPEFLASESRSMPPWFFDQEYMTEFRDTDEQFFDSDSVYGALTDEVAPLFPTSAAASMADPRFQEYLIHLRALQQSDENRGAA
jgi:hypothetical protein